MLRSIQNWVLGSFLIYMIVKAYKCWLYATPAIALTVGQYVMMILVFKFFFPCISIYDQRPRFLNSLPVSIALHDTSSIDMMDVPPI